MTDKTLADLQRELNEARATLELERGERLRAETIRAAVAARGAADPAAVEAVVAGRTKLNHAGDLCGVADDGQFAFGTGRGCYQSVDDLLDELAVKSPELFNPGKGAPVEKNPFVPGPNWNFTEIMRIWKTDPERAEHLEYLAGIGSKSL